MGWFLAAGFRVSCRFLLSEGCPCTPTCPSMQAGRSAKRQLFLLPGGIERHLKIKTCSVSQRGHETQCTPRLW